MERLAVDLTPHVERVVIESRGPGLDRNDRRVLAAVGARGGCALAYEFPIGRDEPVLWAADVVASSVFQALRRDKNDLLAALGDMTVLDVDGVWISRALWLDAQAPGVPSSGGRTQASLRSSQQMIACLG